MKDADSQIIALLHQIKDAAAGGAGAVWGAITGTLSNQADLQAALDAKPGYLVYTALLTQSSTDAPVATVLQNTLGGVPAWSYISPGIYDVTLAGTFTLNKTAARVSGAGDNSGPRGVFIIYADADHLRIQVCKADNSFGDDDKLNAAVIEILVYP